ncbi:hypothetical protein R2R35_22920 [Anaerocolumna sp. AGMB13020]|uniref:hypothetical protein n=1 Tax=Anaerocolumna sp. AGMB13020 TaxID=3081750 RepID=UPI002954ABCA|nr:hypothetical protein [Anaerocolumna sp. AGMB13020]WOO36610.1 hypothetical protein R2R35_22920 [Anaerocolumna sp. AGMB13020]
MGRKQTIKLLGILVVCLFISACEKNVTDNSQNVNNRTNSTAETSKEITGVSKPMDVGDNEKNIAFVNGLKDESLKVKIEDKDNGVLSLNVKEESNLVLMCKDSVNDIIYYVNYGRDYFIYRIKEGKVEPAVKMPAKRLFFMGDKVYFMLETYDIYNLIDMQEGNIFCYDPGTGDIKKIFDGSAAVMSVYKDGIYYKVENNAEMSLYCYSFAEGKSRKIEEDFLSTFRWRDYYIAHKVEEVSKDDELYKTYGTDRKLNRAVALVLKELGQNEIEILSEDPLIKNYAIADDKFYYMSDARTFIIYDLITKEQKEYSLLMECDGDFIILDGYLYLDSLLKLDLNTGKQSVISPVNENEKIYELYTDGKHLFGLCGQRGGIGNGVLQLIKIVEESEKAFEIEKENGASLEMNRFQFQTVPMGKE